MWAIRSTCRSAASGRRGPTTAGDARQAMEKAEHSCARLRSEPVDGQPADLYNVQSKTAAGSSASQIWISSATGLPLRQSTTMEQGATKMKHEARFDYA